MEVGVGVVGARLYLAMPGGIVGREALGSVSSQMVGARAELRAATTAWLPDARLAGEPSSLTGGAVRVMSGPRADRFPDLHLESEWRVRAQSDRVGLRLYGAAPAHGIELPSEPMCVGAVQATPAGGLLILGPDGPTIGGYPHVATVLRADLSRVGQLRPGQVIQLQIVGLDEAREAWKQWERDLAAKGTQLALRLNDNDPSI